MALCLKPQDYKSFVWEKKRYYIWMPLNEFSGLVFDLEGKFYQFIRPLPKTCKIENNGNDRMNLAPGCRVICGKKIRRLHLTCVSCLYKMVWTGKIPNLIPMSTPYLLLNRTDRKFARLKNSLRKPLLSISEFLSFI